MSNPTTRRILEIGGIVSGLILIAFGAVAIYMSFDGRSTVQDNLANEFIVGSSDMNPSDMQEAVDTRIKPNQDAIAAEREKAGVEPIEFTALVVPSCSVADETIDSGTEARCFAQYVRLHALRDASGLTYSQLGKYVARSDAPIAETDFAGGTDTAFLADGTPVAEVDPKTNQPIDNPDVDLWVTATALSSALNLAYTAEQIALFGAVVGVALLLTGIGLLILSIAVLHRRSDLPEQQA